MVRIAWVLPGDTTVWRCGDDFKGAMQGTSGGEHVGRSQERQGPARQGLAASGRVLGLLNATRCVVLSSACLKSSGAVRGR